MHTYLFPNGEVHEQILPHWEAAQKLVKGTFYVNTQDIEETAAIAIVDYADESHGNSIWKDLNEEQLNYLKTVLLLKGVSI